MSDLVTSVPNPFVQLVASASLQSLALTTFISQASAWNKNHRNAYQLQIITNKIINFKAFKNKNNKINSKLNQTPTNSKFSLNYG